MKELTEERSSDHSFLFQRLLGVFLFLAGVSVIIVAFLLLERSEWTEDDLFRTLPLAGIISVFFLLALLIQVALLLGRRKPDRETRSKVIYSVAFGGPIGLLWSVFLLTRRSVGEQRKS
jgi:formate-dependent nitrite reductase membrane component NrfD